MSPEARGMVGQPAEFSGEARPHEYETRIIVVAQGLVFHDEDNEAMAEKVAALPDPAWKKYKKRHLPYCKPLLEYLQEKFKDEGFKTVKNPNEMKKVLTEHKLDGFKSVRGVGLYTSERQKVKFVIVVVVSKSDFKLALETEKLHVIYGGHSRYGRGACFDTYEGLGDEEGDQWEDGTSGNEDSGLFRLGYPYVPIPLKDIAEHWYHFTPVPVEDGEPPNERTHPFSRHRDARKALIKINLQKEYKRKSLPNDIEGLTKSFSGSREYYGLWTHGKRCLLLKAGWKENKDDIFDPCRSVPNLGATNMNCKVYLHIGCSSRLHFWHIIRRKEYKGWERPDPPTDKYAYFTNDVADIRLVYVWLCYVLAYDKENKDKPWWDSLEWAKKETNKKWFRLGKRADIIY